MLNSSQAAHFVSSSRQRFFDAADMLGFATFDTSLYWSYFYTFDNNVEVRVVDDHLVHFVVRPDLRPIYRCTQWVVPFSTNLDQVKHHIVDLLDRTGEPIHYVPEQAVDQLLLPKLEPFVQDKACYTDHIIKMAGSKLSRKRNGIKRYLKDDSDYKLVYWPNHDRSKALALIDHWMQDKEKRRPEDGLTETTPFKVIAEATDTTLEVLKGGKGIFLEHQGRYVAFGFGAQVSNKRWAMFVRISDCSYQYASDFMFNACAKQWEDVPIETDGPAFIDTGALLSYKDAYGASELATNFWSIGKDKK